MSSSSSFDIPGVVAVDISDDSSVTPEKLFDLTINARQFEASLVEDNMFPGAITFAVGKGSTKNSRGCVVITFDVDPGVTSACLEWFGYDQNCTKGITMMPKESKTMLVGSLLAFRKIAPEHVKVLYLNDESSFRCEDHPSAVRTMLASLFLHGKSYYQKLLGVRPSERTMLNLHKSLTKMKSSIPKGGADKFWSNITKGSREDRTWLEDNKGVIFECLTTNDTWRKAVVAIHSRLGCRFFACAHDQLSHLFGTSDLMGSDWKVDVFDLPKTCNGSAVQFQLVEIDGQAGGGRSKAMTSIRRAAKAVVARRAARSEARMFKKYLPA